MASNNGDGLKSGQVVAKPSGTALNTGQRSGAKVAAPAGGRTGNGWKSGQVVASPSGPRNAERTDSGTVVAKPAGNGGGTSAPQIVTVKPSRSGSPKLDPRDYLP